MIKKIVFTVLVFLISFYTTAQNDLNSYKYIIVPKKFDLLKVEDQYQINSLTKFLFNKYGYQAYFMDDDFPEDLKKDRCLALTSDVVNVKSGMFKTKLQIVLKDCFGKVVVTSEIGESRLKKFDRAYNEALRGAFETFQKTNYKYVPKEKSIQSAEPITKVEEKTEIAIDKIEVPETKKDDKELSEDVNTSEIYYAQAKSYGYQLVDAEPKIVMILLATAAENVYLVKDKNAIVFKEDGFWYYSENNGKLKEKKSITIKL